MDGSTIISLQCSTFTLEVTPPIGHALCGGLVRAAVAVRDPLYARGLILDDGKTRVVLCAVDYCAITDKAYQQARLALARGAKTSPRNVALHTVHQHDAPYIQLDAEPILKRHGIGQLDETWWAGIIRKLGGAASRASRALRPVTSVGIGQLDETWWAGIIRKLGGAASRASRALRPVTSVGIGKTRVSGCASNRRLVGSNGKVHAMRFSRTTNPKLQAWPVGLIDPMVRTITLWNRHRLIASLSYYATHPQSAYDRGLVSGDTIAEALRRIRRDFPSAFHIYFTGCGGNISYGKYATSDPEENVRRFGRRIADGITGAVRDSKTSRVPCDALRWHVWDVKLPFRAKLSKAEAKRRVASAKEPLSRRILAAWSLATISRQRHTSRVEVQSLELGPARVVHLPSEVFVEYQLYAQSLRPDEFVAVAAHGDGKMFYLPTAKAFSEGGYEVSEQACYTTPRAEAVLQAAIRKALA